MVRFLVADVRDYAQNHVLADAVVEDLADVHQDVLAVAIVFNFNFTDFDLKCCVKSVLKNSRYYLK